MNWDELLAKYIDTNACCSAALEAARVEREKSAADQAEVVTAAKEATDSLVRNGRITEAYRAEAEQQLATHLGALKVLKTAADTRVMAQPAAAPPLGKETDAATVNGGYVDMTKGPYVGQRTAEKTGADAAYERHLRPLIRR